MGNDPGPKQLAVFLFTDLLDSVGLKRRIGTETYARLLTRHDELFRASVSDATGGHILQDTGDGFLALFDSASAAASAAIFFQRRMAKERWEPERLVTRIGLHLGEAIEMPSAERVEESKLVGTSIDLAARIMGLAEGGQILLTRAAFDSAREHLRGEEFAETHWTAHGPYLLKGIDEPVEVFEVGDEGIAPFTTPVGGEKAERAVSPLAEEVLGWRPAIDQGIPGREGWRLERKLAEGGFGEVWVARQEKTMRQHVFKFCFDADRLRSFKRELTLFRLLSEGLGHREDIAQLYDVQLEDPPFYVESEYAKLGNLRQWAELQGGIASVPVENRMDLLARTADAVSAAHSLGIIHKDLKPSNVLIYEAPDGSPRPRLADFGIGLISDRSALADMDITSAGFTETLLAGNDSSRTGTRLYAPPESQVGAPASTQGDVYALGVMLYQLAIGDFDRPLGTGWERDVRDALLREDIRSAVEADPERRLDSVSAVADRVRSLDDRRAARGRRLRTGRRLLALGMGVALLVVGPLVYGALASRQGVLDDAAFRKDATKGVRAIERELARSTEVLYSLVAAFDASDHLSREEFHLFIKRPLQRVPQVRFLAWAPRVPREDRPAFERAMRAQGFQDFQIWESWSDGSRGEVPAAEEYVYPVEYFESLVRDTPSQQDQALGFDLEGSTIHRLGMARAARSGEAAAVWMRGTIFPRLETAPLLAVIAPVRSDISQPRPIEAGSSDLDGFAFSHVDARTVVASGAAAAPDLDFTLRGNEDDPSTAKATYQIELLGQSLWVDCEPTQAWLDKRRAAVPVSVATAASVLVLMAILAVIYAAWRRRAGPPPTAA